MLHKEAQSSPPGVKLDRRHLGSLVWIATATASSDARPYRRGRAQQLGAGAYPVREGTLGWTGWSRAVAGAVHIQRRAVGSR